MERECADLPFVGYLTLSYDRFWVTPYIAPMPRLNEPNQ